MDEQPFLQIKKHLKFRTDSTTESLQIECFEYELF